MSDKKGDIARTPNVYIDKAIRQTCCRVAVGEGASARGGAGGARRASGEGSLVAVLLTACIVITRRAIAFAEGRAVLNSDSYVINRNWKSLIMFGCSESNKTVYKRARASAGRRGGRLRDF
ncbi:hypothetical protein EVAR_100312_1 [Eumeta japonica]|uniref:Uncharacterized protein n=1 Tax=Eumeta variegata TaxID=151549 RepID=A0A4C1ZUH7_EUMVA|nr:hypothetical protein EVAR_100312_1 [Eumeta japonica]